MTVPIRRKASRLLPAGLLTLAACAGMPEYAKIPPTLAVPGNPKLAQEALATGVQVYRCSPSEEKAAPPRWVLEGPDAALYTVDGIRLGHHGAGPTWMATDGSQVVGAVVAQVPSPDEKGVPWLLLNAKSTQGRGVFAHTAYIQRVKTTGGKAPAEGCDAAHAGRQVRVPYTATYYFYDAKP